MDPGRVLAKVRSAGGSGPEAVKLYYWGTHFVYSFGEKFAVASLDDMVVFGKSVKQEGYDVVKFMEVFRSWSPLNISLTNGDRFWQRFPRTFRNYRDKFTVSPRLGFGWVRGKHPSREERLGHLDKKVTTSYTTDRGSVSESIFFPDQLEGPGISRDLIPDRGILRDYIHRVVALGWSTDYPVAIYLSYPESEDDSVLRKIHVSADLKDGSSFDGTTYIFSEDEGNNFCLAQDPPRSIAKVLEEASGIGLGGSQALAKVFLEAAPELDLQFEIFSTGAGERIYVECYDVAHVLHGLPDSLPSDGLHVYGEEPEADATGARQGASIPYDYELSEIRDRRSRKGYESRLVWKAALFKAGLCSVNDFGLYSHPILPTQSVASKILDEFWGGSNVTVLRERLRSDMRAFLDAYGVSTHLDAYAKIKSEPSDSETQDFLIFKNELRSYMDLLDAKEAFSRDEYLRVALNYYSYADVLNEMGNWKELPNDPTVKMAFHRVAGGHSWKAIGSNNIKRFGGSVIQDQRDPETSPLIRYDQLPAIEHAIRRVYTPSQAKQKLRMDNPGKLLLASMYDMEYYKS